MTEKGRSEKDEILHSADAPFRMTKKKRVRMTEKRGDSSVAYAPSDAVLSEAKE